MRLHQFVNEFCTQPFGSIVPSVFHADNIEPVAKIVVYRKPPFQVTLIVIWHGHINIPEHRHPNVDTVQVLLAGDLDFYVDHKLRVWEPLENPLKHALLQRTVSVPRNALHTAHTGNSGAIWWSFEEWSEGSISTTVDDWDGVAFSPSHYNHLTRQSQGIK